KNYKLSNEDVILQKTTYTFDVSVWELLWWSLVGAKVRMLPKGEEKDPEAIVNNIKKGNITVIHFVPSMLNAFMEYVIREEKYSDIKTLKKVFSSGEALEKEQSNTFNKKISKQNSTRLINLYGPTEATVDVTYYECKAEENEIIPIGKPIDNTRMYIVDKANGILPIGVAGELCISGVGLARGYINNEKLTGEKFVANSYEPLEKMYKTGDLARWLLNGNIQYLGRIDHQVKIRGYRIELGEIEACLKKHQYIKNAAVLYKEDKVGDKYLAAYIETDKSNFQTIDEKNRYTLPNNMSILHLNKNETDFMYKEIFVEQNYLKHNISIKDGDCIFDVGANIGMVTMFMNQLYKDIKVFSFEPIPDLFKLLEINATLYGNDTKVFNCGVSNENKEAVFTFYPKASIMSGKYADVKTEKETFSKTLYNHDQVDLEEKSNIDKYYSELVEERFEAKEVICQLKTLSEIIKETNVKQIDLLKIDVEKSELDVLNGIAEVDWSKIKQIVLEVHDSDNQLNKIMSLLNEHEFNVLIDNENELEDTNLYNIYAIAMSNEENGINSINECNIPKEIPIIEDSILTRDRLCDFLKINLPEYMVPSCFIQLEKMPLTSNGKIDRKNLPESTDNIVTGVEYAAPRNEIEEKLVKVWSEVLGIEKIGIDDDFFT
ncbi:FkbM family methyltransferase, partial [Clostridium estertheticum]